VDEVILADYDPVWPAQFEEIAGRVRAAFADGLRLAVEHVGSTAVMGLAAKPIIDIDVIVPAPVDVPDAIARLVALGYMHQGDLGIAGREAFQSPPGTVRHHLYLCAYDNAEYLRHVAFRDYLRQHTDEAKRYATLKHELATRFREDRVAYSDGKSAYVEAVLAKVQE
jgi:GrpB-like predicted nucleotidyltransferase (UPF0157 family)